MTRSLAAAFLVLLFIAGMAAGVFVDRLFLLEPRLPPHAPPHGPAGGPPGPPPPHLFLGMLERELRLTPEQRVHVEAIVGDAQREAHEALEAVRPTLEASRKRTSERIAAVLTPEQRARFEQLERERPPPPMGPPEGRPDPPPLGHRD